MNEIPKTATAPVPLKAVPVSAVVAAHTKPQDGKELPLPVEVAKPKPADVKDIKEHVEAAVAQMNEFIQSTQRDLHFSYDSAAGETVVKVLDRNTQEVIRQIPDAIFLKMAHSKGSDGNFNLFSAQA